MREGPLEPGGDAPNGLNGALPPEGAAEDGRAEDAAAMGWRPLGAPKALSKAAPLAAPPTLDRAPTAAAATAAATTGFGVPWVPGRTGGHSMLPLRLLCLFNCCCCCCCVGCCCMDAAITPAIPLCEPKAEGGARGDTPTARPEGLLAREPVDARASGRAGGGGDVGGVRDAGAGA